MADIIQKVIEASGYINGAAIVTVTPLPNRDKTRLPQTINDNGGIASITGILDPRFDDPRYYTGDGVG
jgi:hypothetical protein